MFRSAWSLLVSSLWLRICRELKCLYGLVRAARVCHCLTEPFVTTDLKWILYCLDDVDTVDVKPDSHDADLRKAKILYAYASFVLPSTFSYLCHVCAVRLEFFLIPYSWKRICWSKKQKGISTTCSKRAMRYVLPLCRLIRCMRILSSNCRTKWIQ